MFGPFENEYKSFCVILTPDAGPETWIGYAVPNASFPPVVMIEILLPLIKRSFRLWMSKP